LQAVTDEDERRSNEETREKQREADLVINRLRELRLYPIKGNFNAEHLKAIHGYIFQDLPHHRPGVVREDTKDWIKHRALEGRPVAYDVHYASQGIEAKISNMLEEFGGPAAVKGMTPHNAAARIAQLYGALDHAHGFYEGNSRTLREFTRELVEEAGFTLDWVKSGVGAKERNALYLARDLAVLDRAFPGLTEEKAMQTNDRVEYEAFYTITNLRSAVGARSLDVMIAEALTPRAPGPSKSGGKDIPATGLQKGAGKRDIT
jgi:cell filamentation protein